MHRPQKKKKADEPATETGKPEVDERHLVGLDDAIDMSFEDRMVMYWSENKNFILGCITVLLLVVVGYQGMRIYANFSAQKLGADYNAAASEGGLAAFAESHSGEALGGFAALQAADEAYEAGDYAAAAGHYGLAAETLDGNPLEGRAAVGHAFALIRSGDRDAGMAALEAVSQDLSLPESARGEAAYHLAVDAYSRGDEAGFETYFARIEESAFGGAWVQRLDYLRGQMR